MDLRLYQRKLLQDIRFAIRPKSAGGLGHRRVCVVLPTGGGKTVIFSAMAAGAVQKGKSVWAVAHRAELIYQMSDKFSKFGLHHGIIKPGVPETPSLVQCCMVQTLKNRLLKSSMLQPPNLFIYDECHHVPANTYVEVMNMLPQETIIIGFTATPIRRDGKGLSNYFDHLIVGPDVQELTSLGYLVPAKVFQPKSIDASGIHTRYGDYVQSEVEQRYDENEGKIIGDLIETYKQRAPGRPACVFTISVEWACKLADRFSQAGIPSIAVYGSLTPEQRADALQGFATGRYMALMTCDLISEGYDVPAISCVILGRLSKSMGLIIQQIGRGLRTEPGKRDCIILDHVGATLPWPRGHGLPDEPRDWESLWRGVKRDPEDDDDEKEPAKTCGDCFLAFRGPYCPDCGVKDRGTFEGKGREIEEVDGELVLAEQKKRYLDGEEYQRLINASGILEFKALCEQFDMEYEQCRKICVARAASLDELEKVAKALSYHPDWANRTYGMRHGEAALQEEIARRLGPIATQIPGVTPHV